MSSYEEQRRATEAERAREKRVAEEEARRFHHENEHARGAKHEADGGRMYEREPLNVFPLDADPQGDPVREELRRAEQEASARYHREEEHAEGRVDRAARASERATDQERGREADVANREALRFHAEEEHAAESGHDPERDRTDGGTDITGQKGETRAHTPRDPQQPPDNRPHRPEPHPSSIGHGTKG